ncbi:C40 family peptidase [Aureimonas altamirensis]|uniref:C40 family peptidase n=1 Tax=Aureimonas altamirensis TaxID=370622 RepID=UPI0020370CF0|nr:NlpC/P60 family protein [Aureimonas altamirensis]MCM2504710.1 C40 family peptidase [Aureimonas altamirensis]
MTLDRRRNAARPDLADARLKGQVTAERFVDGRPARIIAPLAPLRRRPASDAPLETEALCGEALTVFEDTGEGWMWVQLASDRYVGWMPSEVVAFDAAAPTHIVTAPRTLVFPGPDIKRPPLGGLTMGAGIVAAGTAEDVNGAYVLVQPFGAVVARHCRPVADAPGANFVGIAEGLMNAPYLWGGKSALGIDCSGLVQLAAGMAGLALPRDTDMQEAEAGAPLAPGEPMRRGDLVFWKGHVGIMRDARTLLHANAHHMMVASEPLATAEARAAAKGSPITSRRRLSIG